MGAPDRKSRKRSDASYHSKQPRDLVFFVDKCLGLVTVPGALRATGERVERKTDHFDEDAKDAEWVPKVGAKGWIILSADKELKHNLLEIVALLKSGTHSFILTSGNLSGREMSDAFITAMPDMKGIIESIPPPVVCMVSKSGRVRVAYTHDDLLGLAVDVKDRQTSRAAEASKRGKKKRPG